jgi:putative transposase
MPSRRVAADLNAGTYYLTLTIQRWYYLFDRHNRWQILAESLRYCQENKGLELNGYVFMLNPIRLIVTSDMAGFLRDFKWFTSAQFKSNLETTEPSVLKLFMDDKGKYRFWMDTNAPKKIVNPDFYRQKLNLYPRKPNKKGLCGLSGTLGSVVGEPCFATGRKVSTRKVKVDKVLKRYGRNEIPSGIGLLDQMEVVV